MEKKKATQLVTVEGEMNLDQIKEKSSAMQGMVDETKVTNEDELNVVADKIKNIKQLGKFIKQEKEKFTKPAQAIINEARTKYLPYEKMCDSAEAQLKVKAGAYMTKVEDERIKKEESIAARAENGQLKDDTAVRKMEELGEEKKTVATVSGAKLTLKTVKEVVVADETKIPREYLVLDMVKIRKVALAGVEIPGVEVKETKQMSA